MSTMSTFAGVYVELWHKKWILTFEAFGSSRSKIFIYSTTVIGTEMISVGERENMRYGPGYPRYPRGYQFHESSQ